MQSGTLVDIPSRPGNFLLGNRAGLRGGSCFVGGFLRPGRKQPPVPFARCLFAPGFEVVDERCDDRRQVNPPSACRRVRRASPDIVRGRGGKGGAEQRIAGLEARKRRRLEVRAS
ncbi:MAG TPA: hypothetical protein VNO81_14195 [Candidatus Nitrosotenuis sp.]|jgi:hypothetical protein|nr:hypothetical protein [Candidatus Nitrosotenuis sp.]